MKKALVTGIYGQDGGFLAKQLLQENYEVWGVKRRSASSIPWRLEALGILSHPNLHIIEGDVTDPISMLDCVKRSQPDEVYNTAAMSHVGTSFKQPLATAQIDGLGVLNILEAIRTLAPEARFVQCSTSELYGNLPPEQQSLGVYHPRSPYGVAKLFGFWTTVNYRETYNIFACNSICYNHESALRGEDFVTRKITLGLADIVAGKSKVIKLGNIDARRDWQHAKDACRAMIMMARADVADDFVVATGESHSVREFIQLAVKKAGLGDDCERFIEIDPQFYRPAEVPDLKGNPDKIMKTLGWKPITSYEQLVEEMVNYDVFGKKP